MSATEVHNASRDAAVGKVDMHLEVEIIPVSDVDRSKEFYQRLGWRLDDDVGPPDGLRIVQFTPGLRCLGHVRHRTHDGRARLGRGGADCLRHRSGP
jgi:catechol 2,3-dioxygenase-like lactoylglutathione lyase family enzyme